MAFPGFIPAIRSFLYGRTVNNVMTSYFLNFSTFEVYIDINAVKAITEGFNKNTAVYSITMKYAKKFGCVPRYVYDKAKKEEKVYRKPAPIAKDNGLTELLNRPNEYNSQDLFFTKAAAYHKITGDCFIWLNRGDLEPYRNDDGSFNDEAINKLPVLEMYVLPSDKISLVPDPEDVFGIIGYIFDIGGQKINIRKGDIIQWSNVNLNFDGPLRSHLRGQAPLSSGYKTLQQNNSQTDCAVRMAQNDGARGVMVNKTIGASQNPTQQTQVKTVFDTKINNNLVKGAVAALEGDWHYENFGQTATDLQLLEGIEMSWKQMCFLLGVPYEFYDSHTPYAEKQLVAIGWISNEIYPDCKQLDGEMNRVLPLAFGLENAVFIGSDITELAEMREASITTAKIMQDIWCIAPNEILEYLGFERNADPSFDEPWVPTGQRAPLSDMGAEQEMMDLQNQLDAARAGNTANRAASNGKVPAAR